MHPYSITVILAFPLAFYYHAQKTFWSTVEHDCAKRLAMKNEDGLIIEEAIDMFAGEGKSDSNFFKEFLYFNFLLFILAS